MDRRAGKRRRPRRPAASCSRRGCTRRSSRVPHCTATLLPSARTRGGRIGSSGGSSRTALTGACSTRAPPAQRTRPRSSSSARCRPQARLVVARALCQHDPAASARRRNCTWYVRPARISPASAITSGSRHRPRGAVLPLMAVRVAVDLRGLGLPYAEALACGTPVVATANDGASRCWRPAAASSPTTRHLRRPWLPCSTDDVRRRALVDDALARRPPTTSRRRSTR